MYLRLSFMIAVLVQAVTAPANPIFNVKDFGAKGDGQHIDSPAINAAIEQAAKEGGGMVVLTEGVYPCYSVHLKSNTTLRLEKGAVLKAAPVTETEGYDEADMTRQNPTTPTIRTTVTAIGTTRSSGVRTSRTLHSRAKVSSMVPMS